MVNYIVTAGLSTEFQRITDHYTFCSIEARTFLT